MACGLCVLCCAVQASALLAGTHIEGLLVNLVIQLPPLALLGCGLLFLLACRTKGGSRMLRLDTTAETAHRLVGHMHLRGP